ncbi:hypothetical protein PR202_gb22170 [Eleusine coracana subsp. coracana]|uniref:Cytochrome b561 and DOMON domain-containing protein n=1 Tax=Eleusine coracana subsp. coracana TaxID=191504 RepID=A0AAV5FEZ3_ELECO|nr:hypothetical protein QOZ80_6AG0540420 [Eleusine coracana subsp. coracana]GJN33557.1 hypothetical protein PR202_gb22170 [Eleusine coracana subsp. coracana]
MGVAVVLLLALALLPPPPSATAACATEASFPSNRAAYAACADLPHLGASLHWAHDASSGDLSVAFVARPAAPGGWVAWGINPSGAGGGGMPGTQALVAAPYDGNAWSVRTYNITEYALGPPGPIAFPASDLAAELLAADGRVAVFGRINLGTGAGVLNHVWQVGAAVSGGSPAPHAMGGDNLAAKGQLDLVRATAGAGAGADDSATEKRNIHGILNAASWGILLPTGAIVARYLKTFRSADPAWFYLHVTCQLLGYAAGVAGWATGINLGNESEGVVPGKTHKCRAYWNAYHHSVGYAVVVLGIVNVFKGMAILGVEQRWRTAYIVALFVLGAVALVLEVVTWGVVVRRRRMAENKTFNNSGGSNGHM